LDNAGDVHLSIAGHRHGDCMSVTVATSWIVRKQRPLRVDDGFGGSNFFPPLLIAWARDNDAQKGMGIITQPSWRAA